MGWRFWIDRGGTFTDVVGLDPLDGLHVRKVLSRQPERSGDPAVRAIRELIGQEAIPTEVPTEVPTAILTVTSIDEVRLGTTVATNALLEHHGAPVLLLINRGLADLLQIGDQHRPDIFALAIERPRPLQVRVLEVEGRLAADGSELEPLRLDDTLAAELRAARAAGYGSCAVALLHACRNPEHERRLGAWLEGLGVTRLALSHQLSRQPRLVPRGHTTLVEAAVAPVLDAYLEQVRRDLGAGPRLRVMRSSGSLAAPELLHAKDTILSGPAGGMVGAVAVAEQALAAAGEAPRPVVGFDMGGTSTDVFHFDPALGALAWERQPETEVAGLRLQAPMLPIHTVAAGGGSIVRFEGQRLIVGPDSAGADPGPAAYRRGGPATITDANLLLGRLPAAALPPVFGPGGDQGADPEAARDRFASLAARMGAAPGQSGAAISPERVAAGALAIAIETMAGAIRRISIQRGHDLRGALLVSYGRAGGQHACRLAEALGVSQLLLHPLAGVLSAYGIGRAEQRLLLERSPRLPLDGRTLEDLRCRAEALTAQARADLHRAGDLAPGESGRVWWRLELRFTGSEQGLVVAWEPSAELEELLEAFGRSHQRRFGYRPAFTAADLVVERLLVELAEPLRSPPPPLVAADAGEALPGPGEPVGPGEPEAGVPTVPVWLDADQGPQPVPLWQRSQLRPGQELQGPALVLDPTSTTLLETHWSGRVLEDGALLLRHQPPGPDSATIPSSTGTGTSSGTPQLSDPQAAAAEPPDPTLLELYNHRFSAIAEQMGVQLQQSARSVNIRERLDFSCAVFDGRGRLVANAPHIPVHLGSMGESIAALLAAIAAGRRPPLGPEDVVLSNNPYDGGTHLPDITAITPVYVDDAADAGAPLFYVASRGHHADVGGITPGSMPAFSRRIEEEGLLLDNCSFLRAGRLDERAWLERFGEGEHPVRDPAQLLADLKAQAAANRLGVRELLRLLRLAGQAEVEAYMGHVQANAAEAVRRTIERLQPGHAAVELDDGSHIRVAVSLDHRRRRARIDFSGTSPQQDGNHNAPLAITKAVVLYVFRCLVGEDIPLNAGCFEPLELVVPEGSLLHPRPPAAVVAGNVETSQALANALFAALGVQAAAQGTMNNLSFGNERFQYYETICGGSGAGRDLRGRGFAGASAVQTHMTNSRLTDPEVLEQRFPVRLESFAIRRGSGGAGRWPGGDGVVRRLRFLAPMTVDLLSGSRRIPPAGLAGGGDAQPGTNRIERADGRGEPLGGRVELKVQPGDVLVIETPGGGGYGAAEPWQEAVEQEVVNDCLIA
ncbi:MULTISPECIES: hydantoinase B/oxoprolinase family protein [Aphanothece]|uniref:hydantoinase B/oxoprolinase family protein n=1 Tax=Aphanothece TaxID=1121 RepID=UPI0039852F13